MGLTASSPTSGGKLQADAYRGYDALYATGRVLEIGCWATPAAEETPDAPNSSFDPKKPDDWMETF